MTKTKPLSSRNNIILQKGHGGYSSITALLVVLSHTKYVESVPVIEQLPQLISPCSHTL